MKRSPPNALPSLLTAFFRAHLEQACGASPHTLRAYGMTMRLYLLFLGERTRRRVEDLGIGELDVDGVLAFLDHLERDRGNGVSSRNCRLAALRSFFRFLRQRDPANAAQYDRVLALSSKRTAVRPAVYLEPEQMRAILAQPDCRSGSGVRDYALLLFLYNTGARVAEALALRIEDVEFGRPTMVRIMGKGKRERRCPLWRDTIAALRRLVSIRPVPAEGSLFRNARGEQLTRDGVAYILRKHVRRAAIENPALGRVRVTPHVLRHSCAVALLQAGVDLTVIRDYLGHVSVSTTSRYVTSNMAMKRDVLEAFWRRAGIAPRRPAAWKATPNVLRFLESL